MSVRIVGGTFVQVDNQPVIELSDVDGAVIKDCHVLLGPRLDGSWSPPARIH